MSPLKLPASATPPPSVRRTPAASRILETAERLFYAHGIGRVGVDTIVAESGVAKTTLYAHFRTKDELVAAYLASRSERQREQLEPLLSGDASPSDRVLTAFAQRAESLAAPEWRGCAFLNARAEYPDPEGIVSETVDKHRAWIRAFFKELLHRRTTPTPRTPPAAWR